MELDPEYENRSLLGLKIVQYHFLSILLAQENEKQNSNLKDREINFISSWKEQHTCGEEIDGSHMQILSYFPLIL